MPPTRFHARCRAGGRRPISGALATLALAAACEIPTSAPIIDARWVVPSKSTTIAVANLLPTGVSILPDSSGFTLSAGGASVTRTLGQDCGGCAAANGTTIPKPAFTANASASTTLPSEVASATLTGGSLAVSIQNGFNFDPLRPSAAAGSARGWAVITVRNGATVIGRDSVDGSQTALPAGGTLNRSIALAGPVTGSSPVTVSLVLNSPSGDPVQIDASRQITVSATPSGLRVASASVAVVNRQVSSTTTADANFDRTITDRLQGGALLLTITNPFNVGGTLTVQLRATNGTVVTKTVPLVAGTSSPRVEFTKTELQNLLQKSASGSNALTITFNGAVSATGGAVTVSPRQAVVVDTRLDLSLQVGG